MKKLALAAVAAVALVAPTASHAQLSLGARVGYAKALGDLKKDDLVANQVPIQIDLDYRLFLGLTIGVYGSYGSSGVDGAAANCSATGVDCTGRIIRAGVQATFTLPLPLVKPWVGAGLGYEWARIARSNAKALTASGMEAFNGQLGVDLSLGYFRVGPFLTYTLSKYDAQTLVDSTVSTADLKSAKGGFLYYGLRVRVDP
ncbi:MAG: hypothetical protein U0229_23230 [Anaeromyxobacter sp.]